MVEQVKSSASRPPLTEVDCTTQNVALQHDITPLLKQLQEDNRALKYDFWALVTTFQNATDLPPQELEDALRASAKELISLTDETSKSIKSVAAGKSEEVLQAELGRAALVKAASELELFYNAAKRFDAERENIEGIRAKLEVLHGGHERFYKVNSEKQYMMLGKGKTPESTKLISYIEEEAKKMMLRKEEARKEMG